MSRAGLTYFLGNRHSRGVGVLVLVVVLALVFAATYQPGTASAAQLGERMLTRGDRGDDVRALQRLLKAEGYRVGWIDGVYGPATQKAVRSFQRDQRLPVTGRADALTIRELLVKQPKREPLVVEAAAPLRHVVEPGDTLSELAARYNTTVRAIMEVNGLSSTVIYVGQTLKLPGLTQTGWDDSYYTVKRGDMLSVLAQKFGTTVRELKRVNGLKGDLIMVGQRLRIPGSPTTLPSSGVYTVKAGDTLSVLAVQFDTTVRLIMEANELKGTTIYVGQKLRIPGAAGSDANAPISGAPLTHVVRRGESLWTIAAKYGTTIRALKRANDLSRSTIYVGEVLTIPGTGGMGGAVGVAEASAADRRALAGRVIVLDPGHGGEGTCGTYGLTSGVHESVIVMDIARRLEKALNAAGATVVLTREEDGSPVGAAGGTVSLAERVRLAERVEADVLVSIHSNWSDDPKPTGVITFYYYGKSSGRRLGSAVHPHLVAATNMHDGGVRASGYYVVHHVTMPAILVEIGFMSNPRDEALLLQESFRQRAAEGLFRGLVAYFSSR